MAVRSWDSEGLLLCLRCSGLSGGPHVEYGHIVRAYQAGPSHSLRGLKLICVLALPECNDCSSKYLLQSLGLGWNASCEVILTKKGSGLLWIPRLWKGCCAVLLKLWWKAYRPLEAKSLPVASPWPWGLFCWPSRGKRGWPREILTSPCEIKGKALSGKHIPGASRGTCLQDQEGGGFPNHVLRISEFKPISLTSNVIFLKLIGSFVSQ